MQNTKTFIKVWNRDEDSLHKDYGSAYQFALYLCGGDFTQFDDINTLVAFLSTQPIVPSKAWQAKQKEEDDELPF